MGRRLANGVVGAAAAFGQLSVTGNTLTTTQSNTNLVIDPQGTGTTQFVGNIQLNGTGSSSGEVRLGDGDSSNYIAFRAATTVTSNRTLTFPDSVGSNGQVLQTDGSGNLSWVAQTTAGVSISTTAGGSAGSTHYPYYALTTSGQLTTANYDANFTFVPSTGTLFSTIGQHPTVSGSSSANGQITIRGTTNATKNATASILMPDGVTSSSTSTGTLVVTGGVGISNNLYVGNNINVTGTLSATSKSFLIDHPTIEGKKLRYGSLEGPENGVYIRGQLKDQDCIDLPEYWTSLVDANTITVNLTPIGSNQKLYVEKIEDNKVYIKSGSLFGNINCFYIILAERKDIAKLIVEE